MKISLWNEKTALGATGGYSTQPWTASGISFDSRSINEGDLFIAISAKQDGHDFVKDAFEKGAAAAMVSFIPKNIEKKYPLLIVADVKSALIKLAAYARKRSKAKFIGITGTAGKTSTKNIAHLILEGYGKTHSSAKSFNNILGCSITLATAPLDARYVVVEIGTNNLGEVSELSRLVKPHYVIITEVSVGHLEGLKSLKNILREKASICDGQRYNGFALIPSDTETYADLQKEVTSLGSRAISFGKRNSPNYKIINSSVNSSGSQASILLPNSKKISFSLSTFGEHHVRNASSIIALLSLMNLELERSIPILSSWSPSQGRGERMDINFYKSGKPVRFTLIDESYNANPASINSALDTLIKMEGFEEEKIKGVMKTNRRIAILGDMLELGKDEIREHLKIKNLKALENIDVIHCVGVRMAKLFSSLPEEKKGFSTETADQMFDKIVKKIKNRDIISVKGSFSMNMKQIILALRELQGTDL